MSGLIESIRLALKKTMMLEYGEDGKVAAYIRCPLRIPTSWLYGFFYASHPIVPNKIVFDNYMGKGFGCNPKYVAEKLMEKYPGQFDLVWVISKKDAKTAVFPEGIRTVPYNTPESRREYATAKVWVSNYHKISYVRKKK